MSVDNAASIMHRTSSRLTGSTDSQFLDVGRKGGKVLCALCLEQRQDGVSFDASTNRFKRVLGTQEMVEVAV